MNSEGVRAKQIKRKQILIMGGTALLIILVAIGAAALMSGDKTPVGIPSSKDPKTISLVSGGGAYSDREAWRQQLSADMAAMQKRIDEVKAGQATADKDRERRERERDLRPPSAPDAPTATVAAGQNGVFSPPPPPPPPATAPPAPPLPAGKRLTNAVFGGAVEPPTPNSDGAAKPGIGNIIFEDAAKPSKGTGSSTVARAENSESGGDGTRKEAGSYITAGSFARVVILNGLDAPTGGQAQSNPTPVLLRILGAAVLPNGYKADLNDCIVTANGYGDVSAERANIRLDRMSCVDQRGGAIDIKVTGYVAGEDGKSGLRGRLVTKTGQILANALLASIGSGIGEAFRNSAQTSTQNPLGGVTTTVNTGEEFKAGLSTGVGKAFDQLAKYYVTLADKTFPIIEVDGGRVADIVFSKGFVLEGR